MKIKIASENEIKHCYEILHQIENSLTNEQIHKIISDQLKSGYKLIYVQCEDEVICVAGFSIRRNLTLGKHLYLDDYVTEKSVNTPAAGKTLLDFIKLYAKQQGCNSIHLDSYINRDNAQDFYISQDFKLISHHFSMDLIKI